MMWPCRAQVRSCGRAASGDGAKRRRSRTRWGCERGESEIHADKELWSICRRMRRKHRAAEMDLGLDWWAATICATLSRVLQGWSEISSVGSTGESAAIDAGGSARD